MRLWLLTFMPHRSSKGAVAQRLLCRPGSAIARRPVLDSPVTAEEMRMDQAEHDNRSPFPCRLSRSPAPEHYHRLVALCAWVLVGAAVHGCNRPSKHACEGLLGSYEADLLGSIRGRGRLDLRAMGSGRDDVEALFQLQSVDSEAQGDAPILAMRGAGSCREAVAKINFASADNSTLGYKILGGSMTAVLRPEVVEPAFGYWSATFHSTQDDTAQDIAGFWRERIPTAGEDRHVADAPNAAAPHSSTVQTTPSLSNARSPEEGVGGDGQG